MGIIRKEIIQSQSRQREWLDSGGYFLFGKYGGPNPLSVEDVARKDPSYLHWIVETVEDISDEDREVINQHLRFSKRG